MLASVPDAIVTADLDVRIRLVNPAAEQLLRVRAPTTSAAATRSRR